MALASAARALAKQAGRDSTKIIPVREPGWYVLLAHPREEQRAAAALIGHGLKVYLPQLPKRCRAGRKMQERMVPMLPTYLFLRVHTQVPWGRIRGTPGIRFGKGGHCALMSEDAYAVVPHVAMEIIYAKESRLCERPDERPEAPAVGKTAEVISGPFAWLKGVSVDLEVAQIRVV